MKKFELSKEEQKILSDYENGLLVSVADLEEEKKRFQAIARATLNKTKNINIRLSEKDLQKIKAKAVGDGIPYQTLISSVIHRFLNKSGFLDTSVS